MTLRALREARAAKVAELRGLHKTAEDANRDLQPEERTRFTALEGEIEALDQRIRRAERADEMERAAPGDRIDSDTPDFDRACQSFSILRAIASLIPNLGETMDFGREREVSAEIARRTGRSAQGIYAPLQALTYRARRHEARVVVSGGNGAGVIAEDYRPSEMIDALRSRLIVERLGARVLSDLRGNLSLPKLSSSAGASWIAQNAAITPTDPDLDKVTLSPKHVGAITEWSRNMVIQSSPDVETLARMDLGAALAVAVDRAAINGGGSNEPDGVLATITPESLASPTWGDVLNLIAQVETANAAEGSLGWAVHPLAMRTLRATPKVSGDASGGFLADTANDIAGYTAAVSTSVPGGGSPENNHVVFGDWSSLIVGYWGGLDLLVNPYESTAYSKGNISIRALLSCDVALRHDESFAAGNAIGAPA